MDTQGIELSLTQLIGFILVAIVFLGTIGLIMKIMGILGEKPDEATLNSFDNLVYEIKTMNEDGTKEVPYYLGPGLFLDDEGCSPAGVKEDLCVCKDLPCTKVVTKYYFEAGRFVTVSDAVRGSDTRDVKNVQLTRAGSLITISET